MIFFCISKKCPSICFSEYKIFFLIFLILFLKMTTTKKKKTNKKRNLFLIFYSHCYNNVSLEKWNFEYKFTIIILKGGNNKKNIKRRTLAGMLKKFNPFLRRMHLIELLCVDFSYFFLTKECYISLLSLKIFDFFSLVLFSSQSMMKSADYLHEMHNSFFPACIFPHFIC